MIESKKAIYFDGAASPNPGRRGIGFVLFDNHEQVCSVSEAMPGIGTNNEAEYAALRSALRKAIDLRWNECDEVVLVCGDSALVVNQVTGKWMTRKESLMEINMDIQSLREQFKNLQFQWIPREYNYLADANSKAALTL